VKTHIIYFILSLFFLNINPTFSQEWKNLKAYRKETGKKDLLAGQWLEKDRKMNTDIWKNANKHNLTLEKGNQNYKTISQIRDFYLWFESERLKQGHEIKWIGVAQVVAGQLSLMDRNFIRVVIIRNKDVVNFANEASIKVFEYAFPQLRNVLSSEKLIVSHEAQKWDDDYGTKEQCEILEPIYQKLSPKTLNQLDRMVKGKGIYRFGVRKRMRYEGSIEDCKVRFAHAANKISPYIERKTNRKNHKN